MERQVKIEVLRHFGVLSNSKGWTKELNLISVNGALKYDLRSWSPDHKMCKGISMNDDEFKKLVELLSARESFAQPYRGKTSTDTGYRLIANGLD